MKSKVEFRRSKDFGEVIDDTLTFIKQNFKPLLRIFFSYSGIFVLAGLLSMIMFQVRAYNTTETTYGGGIFSQTKFLTGEYFIAMLFSIIAYTMMQVGVLSYIKLYVEKGNAAPSMEEVWGYVKYYFLRAFGSAFLLLILLGLAFICCFIPGIWLFPIVSLFYPAMIVENGSFEYSFSRMFALMKRNWWQTAAIVLVIWLIVYATTLLVVIPTTILSFIDVIGGHSLKGNLIFIIISSVLQYLCQIFIMLPVICSAVCYYSLTEKKESSGLFDRMEKFGQKPDASNHFTEEY